MYLSLFLQDQDDLEEGEEAKDLPSLLNLEPENNTTESLLLQEVGDVLMFDQDVYIKTSRTLHLWED